MRGADPRHRRPRAAVGVVAAFVAACAACTWTTSARAAANGTASLALWLEEDTNPARVATDPLADDEAPVAVVPDALLRVAGDASVDTARPGVRLHADVAGGGKLFFAAADERMVVGALRSSAVVAVDDATALVLALASKARAQRSGARTYGALRADVGLARELGAGWSCQAGGAGVAFDALDEPLFSSAGGGVIGGCGAHAARERVDVTAEAGVRAFPWAPKSPQTRDPARRLDAPLSLTATATSARPVYLQGAIVALRNGSNAAGEAFARLRLQAVVGARLPASVTATLRLAGQWTRYDDGISIGQRYTLAIDDETQNLAELTLTRSLWAGLALDARVAIFGNELGDGGARFARSTAALGLRSTLW